LENFVTLSGAIYGIFLICIGHGLTGFLIIGAGVFCAGLSIFIFYGCKVVTKGLVLLVKKSVLAIKKGLVKEENHE
jgi:hypothetical protein